jgi:plasmid stabilization system protein ParE
MSDRVEISGPAEDDAREAVRWIAQYSTDKATLWYFDFDDEMVHILHVRHQKQKPLSPDEI